MIIKHFQTIGKKATQEDAFYISSDERLFVVCDGVGGRRFGELASQTIINELSCRYESQLDEKRNFNHIKAYLSTSLRQLKALSVEQSELQDISTTLALLYIEEDEYHTAHIGDSRIILLRASNDDFWSTKDHSVVQELFDAGVLSTEHDMKKHPFRNRITKAITANKSNIEDITFQSIPVVKPGDCLILCTDGLLEHYTNNELQKLYNLEKFDGLNVTLKRTCEDRSKDNTTAILLLA